MLNRKYTITKLFVDKIYGKPYIAKIQKVYCY